MTPTDLLSLISRLEGLAVFDARSNDDFNAAVTPEVVKTLCAELRQRIEREGVMLAALKRADQFMTNGIEMGFIRMPDKGSDDPALETRSAVCAAIALAEQKDTTP